MQRPEDEFPTPNDQLTFGKRLKRARQAAGLTQQQLFDLLAEHDATKKIDTSVITRMESGLRDPRFKEALVIARVLGFSLDDLAPQADLDSHLSDVRRSVDDARAALVAMLKSAEPVVDYVRRHPDSMREGPLEAQLERVLARPGRRGARNVVAARTKMDEDLKRRLLRAVTDGILVGPGEVPADYDRWFTDKGDKASPRSRARHDR
ncbi:MAG: helix-turn-helix transcriptional regulator [Mycobacterium sp.]